MDCNKAARMSMLFEKVVAENASSQEQCELNSLYAEFIDEGRQLSPFVQGQSADKKPVFASVN